MGTKDKREDLSEVFETQAFHCRALGSAFTADLCLLFAEHLDDTIAVGRLLHGWPGSASYRADAVPLRLCGALHALVLTGQSATLKAHYPDLSLDDEAIAETKVPAWPLIDSALIEHEAFILEWLRSPPQTNEVRRASGIWPMIQTVAQRTNKPIDLWEIGCSGGLNLRMAHFCYEHGAQRSGDLRSQVVLKPEWKGAPPPDVSATSPMIAGLKGCDINPLDPSGEEDRLRLMAYLWPDQKHRLERTNAAIEIALKNPAKIEEADAVRWLQQHLPQRSKDNVTFIYTTVAWQYLPESAKAQGEALIRQAGETTSAPLAFAQMEGDGESPGGALTLKLWPGGPDKNAAIDAKLGRIDFHGRWVDWQGLPS